MHKRFSFLEGVVIVKRPKRAHGNSVDGIAYEMVLPKVEETHLQSKELPTPATKGSSLFESSIRLFAVAMFISFGWTMMPLIAATSSYFSDTEGSMGLFSSATLDLITDFTATTTPLSCGDYAQFDVGVTGASSSLPFTYTVKTEKTGGSDEFCESLDLTAWLDGNEVYQGDLLDFQNGEETVPSDWVFKVKFPLGVDGIVDGTQCTADLVFEANGEMGYTDTERVPINVVKSGDCGISGDDDDDGECNDPTNPQCPCFNGDVTVIVDNHSSSTVTNNASSSVNTGGNSANGGAGGNGGSGGNGGNGGSGGNVTTGNATSSINITNVINTSSTTITTGCSGCCTGNCGCSGGGNCSHSSTTVTSTSNSSSSSNSSTTTAQAIKDKIKNTLDSVFGNLGIGTQSFHSH